MAKKITKKETSLEEVVKNILDELFEKLEISATPTIVVSEEEVEVTLETEDSGVIIGYHGEGLEALQLMLSLLVAKKTGEYKRILLEVGDYRKKRTEWLERLAQQAKERALSDRGEVVLSDLKPWERRVIHMMFSEDSEVESESQGEGKERALVIRPRS